MNGVNNKNNMKKIIYTIALLLITFVPLSSHAASVYLESSRTNVSVGDTVVITVRTNSDGAILNTIDGEIAFKSSKGGSLNVTEFSLANSSFGLWPRTPSLSPDKNTISFIGGVPGGYSIEGATLFKIVVEARKEGTVTISPRNLSIFANDGKGTKVPVTTKNVVINISAKKSNAPVSNDWLEVVSGDTTPPEKFIVVLGQDPSMFDGRKFAYFSSIDNQSGIDHYEVSENGTSAVRSGSTYVLQDQSDKVKLTVTALDKAGNKTTAIYPVGKLGSSYDMIVKIASIIVLIAVVLFGYKKLTK